MTRARRQGFTLIEVVIALALMVGIGGFAIATMRGTLDMRDYLEQEDVADRSARVALAKIRSQLQLAFLTENTEAVSTYQTVFIGKDEGELDVLYFATLAHRRMYYGAREGDQAEITLWTETGDDGNYILYHRESPRIDEEPDEDGVILPLATGVKTFDLDFLDGTSNTWVEEWDSTGTDESNRLPRAVQVHLVVMGPDPEDPDEEIEHTYLMTILLELADPIEGSEEDAEATSLDDEDTD